MRSTTGYKGENGSIRFNILDGQRQIRFMHKVVIAAVNGWAVSFGHLLLQKQVEGWTVYRSSGGKAVLARHLRRPRNLTKRHCNKTRVRSPAFAKAVEGMSLIHR